MLWSTRARRSDKRAQRSIMVLQAKFEEYLARSETLLAAFIEQGLSDKLPVVRTAYSHGIFDLTKGGCDAAREQNTSVAYTVALFCEAVSGCFSRCFLGFSMTNARRTRDKCHG